jgi:hypothetical protein
MTEAEDKQLREDFPANVEDSKEFNEANVKIELETYEQIYNRLKVESKKQVAQIEAEGKKIKFKR